MLAASSSKVGLNSQFPAAITAWKAHALTCFPNEAVGAILQDGSFAPLVNKAPDPRENAVFDLMTLINKPVAGIVHSHTPGDPDAKGKVEAPSPAPSQTDMENQITSALPWGISVCMKDSVSDPIWWGDSLPIRPLLGRSFLHGVTDCFSLIRDWHRLQGVTFPDFPRGFEWWKQGQDLYAQGFEAAGFVRVERSQPLPGDCFITKVHSKVPNHAGIYLGKGLVFQHLANSMSRRSPAAIWKQKMDFLVRHKDLPEKEVYDAA